MLSPAKINWTLRILGRRADGFHELHSWFLALDWGDDLGFQPDPNATSSILEISGPRANGIPTEPSNLLLQAETLWREAGGMAPFGRWHLNKTIPAGAGLGGGSSNAATALHLLQSIANQPLTDSVCRGIAQQIGSDVDFFFQQQTAELRGGRGEVVLAQVQPPDFHLVLVLADLHAATADVYRSLKAKPLTERTAEEGTQAWPQQAGPNDLQAAAYTCVPGLAELGSRLEHHAPFTMSGSGSSFFAAVATRSQADDLAARLQSDGLQVVICRPKSCTEAAAG